MDTLVLQTEVSPNRWRLESRAYSFTGDSENQWVRFQNLAPVVHIPCTISGFDPRPWKMIDGGYKDSNFTSGACLQRFAHICKRKNYLDTNPTAMKTLTIYAWNECGGRRSH